MFFYIFSVLVSIFFQPFLAYFDRYIKGLDCKRNLKRLFDYYKHYYIRNIYIYLHAELDAVIKLKKFRSFNFGTLKPIYIKIIIYISLFSSLFNI